MKKFLEYHTQNHFRPTNKATVENKGQGNQNAGKSLEVGIADDQAKDFDFEKTEMKYDSTGMFHWTPARSIEDCILDRNQVNVQVKGIVSLQIYSYLHQLKPYSLCEHEVIFSHF